MMKLLYRCREKEPHSGENALIHGRCAINTKTYKTPCESRDSSDLAAKRKVGNRDCTQYGMCSNGQNVMNYLQYVRASHARPVRAAGRKLCYAMKPPHAALIRSIYLSDCQSCACSTFKVLVPATSASCSTNADEHKHHGLFKHVLRKRNSKSFSVCNHIWMCSHVSVQIQGPTFFQELFTF